MLRKFLINNANPQNKNALGNVARRKRMKLFEEKFPEVLQGNVRILDMGGTYNFWFQMGYVNKPNCQITTVNLTSQTNDSNNITSIVGDVCNLEQFEDKSFDIVFSNSVIEHVGKMDNQKKMAEEVRRIGKRYYIQTPNYWFPFEPHFLTPGFQYLSVPMRAWMIRNFNLGWHQKTKDKEASLKLADTIDLLSYKEMKSLFPEAEIHKEKFFGLNKSFIAIC